VAATQLKDDNEAGLGWTCFGGPDVTGVHTVGGWVPGAGATAFPSPTGIRMEPGTQIVMQIHYNLLAKKDVVDRTTADLFFSATPVAKPAAIFAVANLTFSVPAGTKEQTVVGQLPVKTAVALWGVVPHMHTHATKIKVDVLHANGTSDCAVDIPRWDFSWQQFYYYKQPMMVTAGDTVRISCTYDNSPENQPIVNGTRLPPAELRWGEKTTDEMCLNYLYAAVP
jgi:Copper type II ascorbate-dependent monooxygenase, C-terminal domain